MSTAGPATPEAPGALRRLQESWRDRPLAVVVGLAIALRVLAALASRGFAFSDDHFDVVEVAQGWLDGERTWLGRADSYRSLLYPGLHWALFGALQAVGVSDPQAKMLVVRFLHAAWSLLTVVYGYRIAEALAGRDRARVAGLALAVFWLAPYMGVRDLAEVVCQPPLVLATWLLVRDRAGSGRRGALLAGACLGLAFTLRFQTAVFAAAMGLVLLAGRRVAAALWLAVGAALSATVLQGGSDWLGYGRPFSSVLAYLAYNADPANVRLFPRGPWYQHALTLVGLLVPPASLLLLAGWLRGAARRPLVSWPALAFVAVHSFYPGKQERFLLPVLPFVLLAGVLGALELGEGGFWRRRPRAWHATWAWFWALNGALLALYTFNDSKRTRVEPLSFLRAAPDLRGVVLETSEPDSLLVPRFYLGRQVPVFELPARKPAEALAAEVAAAAGRAPNYLVLTGEPALEARLARLGPLCPTPAPVATFRPGVVDRLLHLANPRRNVNLTARVYRCDPGLPSRPDPAPEGAPDAARSAPVKR